jgi:hypothetical protein
MDATDHTAVTNDLLHSLFSQCSVSLNGISITQASELYPYRSYLETILTYGTDTASSHLTNAFWYLDSGDLLSCDPTAAYDANTNKGFIARLNKIKQSKEIQLYGRLHSDICNVSQYLIPGVRLQIKFTKAKQFFFLMNTKTDAKAIFKFLDAQLLVNSVRPNPAILLAHYSVLNKFGNVRYNLTRVELKTFTFAKESKSLSIDNAVLGPIPKSLLFTMIKNTDFLGSIDTNSYLFRHYDLTNFTM